MDKNHRPAAIRFVLTKRPSLKSFRECGQKKRNSTNSKLALPAIFLMLPSLDGGVAKW